MSVHCDAKNWYGSNYVMPQATRKRCGHCGCKIRGSGHVEGTHCKNAVKAKALARAVAGGKVST